MIIELLLFAITGMLAGTAAGLLGIGGGMIVVPCLVFILSYYGIHLHVVMHVAVATSLAVMMFTATASIHSHHQRGNVLWPVFYQLIPGIIVGVIMGAIFADFLPTDVLKVIFAIFLILVAIRMFIIFVPKPHRQLPGPWPRRGFASLIGLKSGLLGVGGGALTVPFLIWCNVPMKNASGISAACTLPIAITGTIVTIITGLNNTHNHFSLGYVYWPAVITIALFSVLFVRLGARLQTMLPVNTVKRIFAVLLLIAAINLLVLS